MSPSVAAEFVAWIISIPLNCGIKVVPPSAAATWSVSVSTPAPPSITSESFKLA